MFERSRRFSFAVVMMLVAGCASDEPEGSKVSGGDPSVRPRLEIQAGSTVDLADPSVVTFRKSQVAVGETLTQTLVIRNTADVHSNELVVDLQFQTTDPTLDEAVPALRVTRVVANGSPVEADSGVWHAEVEPFEISGAEIVVDVEFLRYADPVPRAGLLIVDSNTDDVSLRHVEVPFATAEELPGVQVEPKLVDFGQVNQHETAQRSIVVSNGGVDPLIITSVLFQGHPDLALLYEQSEFGPGEDILLDLPLVVQPNEFVTFEVRFSPLTEAPVEGKVVIYTNDPAHALGVPVQLTANNGGPCIQVAPGTLQFGGKKVGTQSVLPLVVSNCGSADLVVHNLQLTDGVLADETGAPYAASNSGFALDYNELPGFEDGSQPTSDKPLTIPANSKAAVHVRYVPGQESPVGEDDVIVLDDGLIVIQSNAFESRVAIEVTGLGVERGCAVATGVIQEGEQVVPQTTLHLFGDQSGGSTGAIVSLKWSVQQPVGSASWFSPGPNFSNPTFAVNIAGEYRFSLEVWDEAGVKSCVPWKQTVLVVPDEAIHIELIWHTPDDPDETDQGPSAGADLDLHFAHDQYASGPDVDQDGKPDGWFGAPFDCFWSNPHPNWANVDPSVDDDPGLDRDDTDGAGPEILNLALPEATRYRVGVHYWSDNTYGPSLATLRIYIHSELVSEIADVSLVNLDMWEAATIDWPSGNVTLVQSEAGGHKITADYQPPVLP